MTSEKEQQSLLREARERFNKAISLEESFRRAAACLGLALCHAGLGDSANAERAISDFVQVRAHDPSIVLKAGGLLNKAPWWSVIYSGPLVVSLAVAKHFYGPEAERLLKEHAQATAALATVQQEGKRLLEQSLHDGCANVFGLTIHRTA